MMMMVTINNSDNSDGNGDNNNDSDDVHGGDLMMIITMVIKVIMFILPAGSEAWSWQGQEGRRRRRRWCRQCRRWWSWAGERTAACWLARRPWRPPAPGWPPWLRCSWKLWWKICGGRLAGRTGLMALSHWICELDCLSPCFVGCTAITKQPD